MSVFQFHWFWSELVSRDHFLRNKWTVSPATLCIYKATVEDSWSCNKLKDMDDLSFRSSVGKPTGAWLLSPLLYKVELSAVSSECLLTRAQWWSGWSRWRQRRGRHRPRTPRTWSPPVWSTAGGNKKRPARRFISEDRAAASFLHRDGCLSHTIMWRSGLHAHLFLQVRLPEGEQEPLDVLRAQTVDAARVDGPAQELVHFVLWV